MRLRLLWLKLLTLSLAISARVFAQDTASITGTVIDPAGASVPNAHVALENREHGVHRETSTNTAGEFLVPGLPLGSYNLSISAPGFKKYEASKIVLRVAQSARVNVTLQVGAASEEITVSGENTAQVDTQSSELAGTITGKQISQLELNGRNFTQLVTLVPGVSGGQDEGFVGIQFLPYSFNGGRLEYNNWEVDGGDILDNGSNQTLNVYPSIDAIAEVRVLTSNYGAQYGRNGSGTVEAETKSGSNEFHGDAYEFARNELFNARNYFDPPGQPPAYKKNDFGYTLGGPIYVPGVYNKKKDKSFFFWSQEWRIDRVPQVFNVPVPSEAERSGNFSDLCPNAFTGSFADCPIDPNTKASFQNNQVPVDPNAQYLLPMIPVPNAGAPGAEFFNASPTQLSNGREELIRIDHNFGSKLRAMFRFIHDSVDLMNATSFAGARSFPTIQSRIQDPGLSLVARLAENPSAKLLNEFVFSYTTDHLLLTDQGAWQRPPAMTMTGLFDNGFGGKLPGIFLFGSSAYGGGFAQDPGPVPWSNANPTCTFRDNVVRIAGKHNLQFGAYAVAAQKNELDLAAFVQGLLVFSGSSPLSTGNPFADLLMGRITLFGQTNLQRRYYNRYKILEPYFQDDWRVSKRLTLNLGLRISLFGTYRERYKRVFNFDPTAYNLVKAPSIDLNTGALVFPPGQNINTVTGMVQCGAPGVPPGCVKGHPFNPAPRIGFAFDPTGDGKTAIRGGYGIFWEHTNGGEANTESLTGSPPLVLASEASNILGYTTIGGQGLFFPLFVTSIPNKVVWPYVQQWHLDFQRQISGNAVATISYVGSKGTHLTRQRDLNQVQPLPLSQNPYRPGEPIGGLDNRQDDCNTMTTPSGSPVTGQAATNLAIACLADANPFRPFVGFAPINRLEAEASSTYHAFQASLRRSVGGLQFSFAYTYSHAIDNSSDRFDFNFVDSYNSASNRASSNLDQRHVLNVSYVCDLPFPRGTRMAHRVLGGWQVSGITTFQTGTPFSVVNQAFYGDNAGVGNFYGSGSFADLIGDPKSPPPVKFVDSIPGPLLFNPGACAAPRGLTFGNSGRNSLRNPRRTNFDMALLKHLQLSEEKEFEFRAEAFNVFNHTQWAGINNGLNCYGGSSNSAGDSGCIAASNFLHPGSAHRSRVLQLGLKLMF